MTGSPSGADLVALATDLAAERRTAGERAVLGIAGPPGAGKSTLAAGLARAVPGAVVAPMDGFHRTNTELERLGLRHRKGAPATFDAEAFVAALRRVRSADGDVDWPGFDRVLDEPVPAGTASIPPSGPLVVVEGNYLLLDVPPWDRIRPLLHACWFVTAGRDVLEGRLLRRAEAGGRSPADAHAHVTGSDLPNAALVLASAERADLVVSLSDDDPLLADLTDPATGRPFR